MGDYDDDEDASLYSSHVRRSVKQEEGKVMMMGPEGIQGSGEGKSGGGGNGNGNGHGHVLPLQLKRESGEALSETGAGDDDE